MKVLIGPNPMGLEKGIPELKRAYPSVEFVFCADREALPVQMADADVYVGWLNRDLYLAGKKLKWIQSPSSGVNYYCAIDELVASDVLLTSASGTHGPCLSESTFGMIFAFTRGIREAILAQPKHEWAARAIRPKLMELTGSTMGIVGFGRVGRALAKRAAAFDMRIVAVDLFPANKPDYVSELWGLDCLDKLLDESDFAVVTVPYTADTHGMIGAAQIAKMKPTAMLIGISRGGIIDQVALAKALQEGKIAAAALDVCEPEPLPAGDPLWDAPNLLLTPHVAGGTQIEGKYILEILHENVGRFLNGQLPLRNQVDKQRGF